MFTGYIGIDKMNVQDCPCVNMVKSGTSWSDKLLTASKQGHSQCVSKLTALTGSQKDGQEEKEIFLNKALRSASEEGHSETVTALLQGGANVNGMGAFKPLIFAASEGHLQTVQVGIWHGF